MKFDHFLIQRHMTFENGHVVIWAEYAAMCDGL